MGKDDALTQTELQKHLSYDPQTGSLVWLLPASRRALGAEAGYVRPDGYRMITVHWRKYLAHRLAWLHVHGVWPPQFIDHINGNRSDNRLSNLRLADYSTNGMNRPPQINSRWGRGVHKRAGKWIAEIKNNGVKKYLGSFNSPEEARTAFIEAAAATRGEFVRID